jgi:hypothetical protein
MTAELSPADKLRAIVEHTKALERAHENLEKNPSCEAALIIQQLEARRLELQATIRPYPVIP